MSIPTVGAGQTSTYGDRNGDRKRSKPSRRRSKPSRRKKGEPGQGEQYADAQALKRKERSRGTPAWEQVTVESRLKSTATTPPANTRLVWVTGRKKLAAGNKAARWLEMQASQTNRVSRIIDTIGLDMYESVQKIPEAGTRMESRQAYWQVSACSRA